jgi:hypothetical protein
MQSSLRQSLLDSVENPDPHSICVMVPDPDLHSECGSGSQIQMHE